MQTIVDPVKLDESAHNSTAALSCSQSMPQGGMGCVKMEAVSCCDAFMLFLIRVELAALSCWLRLLCQEKRAGTLVMI